MIGRKPPSFLPIVGIILLVLMVSTFPVGRTVLSHLFLLIFFSAPFLFLIVSVWERRQMRKLFQLARLDYDQALEVARGKLENHIQSTIPRRVLVAVTQESCWVGKFTFKGGDQRVLLFNGQIYELKGDS